MLDLVCMCKVMYIKLCVYKVLLMYTSLYTLGVFINFHSWEGPSCAQIKFV